jgi:hypothetical protein
MFQMMTVLCGKIRGMNVQQRHEQVILAGDEFILFQIINRCWTKC